MSDTSKITLGQLKTALTQAKNYTDNEIAGITGVSKVEPEELDMPKVFFYGNALPTTKNNVNLTMDYISNTTKFSSFVKLKCQGTSSMSYAKKNFTVAMYSDEARETKLKKDFKGWGAQSKFCLKANYIDTTHTRNLSGARIAYDMVASRPDSPFKQQLLQCPRNGAVDGFPIKLYFNGEFYGIYTWNIPKDGWMFNMNDSNPNHMVLCAEQNNNGSTVNDNVLRCEFRKEWDGTDGNSWSIEFGTYSDALKNSFNRCVNFVMTASDEEFKANISDYFDLYSLLDYYCFSYLVAHIDGLGKNMLMTTYDGVIWGAALYDMDSIYGADWQGTQFKATNIQCPEQYQETNSLLWQRIESCFSAELYARYLELRQGALSLGNIIKHVEEIYDVIPDRVFADEKAKWTSLPGVSTNTMTRFRNYMRDRAVYVDAQMEEIGSEVACTGITLSANNLSFTATDTQTLTATVQPSNTTDVVTWSVSPAGIVTVNGGVVTPIANGDCTITATCGTQTATCTVNVALPTVACTSISLDKTELALGRIEGEPVDDTGVNYLEGVTWQDGQLDASGNMYTGTDKYAEINVTLPGKYTLRTTNNYTYLKLFAIHEDGTRYHSYIIPNSPTRSINIFEPCIIKCSIYPNSLDWDSSSISLTRQKFSDCSIKDYILELSESDINVKYSNSEYSIVEFYLDKRYNDLAVVNLNNITYKCVGDYTLSPADATVNKINALLAKNLVYSGYFNNKTYISILQPISLGTTASEILANLNSITVTINSTTLINEFEASASQNEKLSARITATVTPDNCTQPVVWSVLPEGIATVNNGLVTAITNGETTVTATCGTQSATCAVTVSGITITETEEVIQTTYTRGYIARRINHLTGGFNYGDLKSSTADISTDFINHTPGNYYVMQQPSTKYGCGIIAYDDNKNYLATYVTDGQRWVYEPGTSYTVDLIDTNITIDNIPGDAAYIRMCFNTVDSSSIIIKAYSGGTVGENIITEILLSDITWSSNADNGIYNNSSEGTIGEEKGAGNGDAYLSAQIPCSKKKYVLSNINGATFIYKEMYVYASDGTFLGGCYNGGKYNSIGNTNKTAEPTTMDLRNISEEPAYMKITVYPNSVATNNDPANQLKLMTFI